MAEFHIQRHTIDGAHLREYRQSILDEAHDPQLEVKSYTPKSNSNPKYGDLTILAAGGIGFVKEVYEPLFDDLEKASKSNGYAIRAIWMADFYVTGASAVLNADNLGNMPSWLDHSRDLLHMVNHFRNQMVRPIVGLGHSMGAAQITHLSLLHPRLLTSLILIEPSIYRGLSRQTAAAQAKAMARRREFYETRQQAAATVMKSPFYAKWDPRARQTLIEYGFVPVRDSEDGSPNKASFGFSVRIPTSKHSEVMLMLKPNYEGYGDEGLDSMSVEARRAVPDVDPEFAGNGVFPLYRPESVSVYRNLPHVRPSVLYVCGSASTTSTVEIRSERMGRTGIGPGGSGGTKLGRVKEFVIEGGVHTLPMDEHLSLVVGAASRWLADEMIIWRAGEAQVESAWVDKPRSEKQHMDDVLHRSLMEWKPNLHIDNIIKSKLS